MQQLVAAFRELNCEFVPSYGNFVLVKVGAAGKCLSTLAKARRHRATCCQLRSAPVAARNRRTAGENERFLQACVSRCDAARMKLASDRRRLDRRIVCESVTRGRQSRYVIGFDSHR